MTTYDNAVIGHHIDDIEAGYSVNILLNTGCIVRGSVCHVRRSKSRGNTWINVIRPGYFPILSFSTSGHILTGTRYEKQYTYWPGSVDNGKALGIVAVFNADGIEILSNKLWKPIKGFDGQYRVQRQTEDGSTIQFQDREHPTHAYATIFRSEALAVAKQLNAYERSPKGL